MIVSDVGGAPDVVAAGYGSVGCVYGESFALDDEVVVCDVFPSFRVEFAVV